MVNNIKKEQRANILKNLKDIKMKDQNGYYDIRYDYIVLI